MKKVFISFDEIDLGYLIETEKSYMFVANEQGILNAQEKNPIAMSLFKLNKTGKQNYEAMPHMFSQFIVTDSRKDICDKAKINTDDSQFEKLFKIAGLNIMKINFKIHQ